MVHAIYRLLFKSTTSLVVVFAFGACISHKIADGSSFSTFVKDWAATSSGESEIYSQFQSSILFPPITSLSGIGSKAIMTKEKLVLKRFCLVLLHLRHLKQNM